MNQLEHYYTSLLGIQGPNRGRVSNPKGTCNTLWIPEFSGNRTAKMNLNHTLLGFRNGVLLGENGNCGTLYIIVELPESWTDENEEEKLNALSELVCQKLGKSDDYPRRRVLKYDQRMPVILEAIKELG